jgi:hypothetical protein
MAACIMQRTQQQTTDRVQRATRNVQHATAIAQRIATNKQRATCNSQQIADDLQQTADDMQEDACSVLTHASCNGKHTALPHFVRGEQRAAHNQQHARSIVLDNQMRNTARTPHTRCNIRPVPQHARNSHKNTRVRRKKSEALAHLGALSVTHCHSAGQAASRLREIRCPKKTQSRERERLKLPKRQEAKERESAEATI